MTDKEIERIYIVFQAPFTYESDSQMIFDDTGQLVVDVRAWGYLQYLEDGIKIQDNLGKMIADLLNDNNPTA